MTRSIRRRLLLTGMGCFAFAVGVTLVNVLLLPCGPAAGQGAFGPFTADQAARQLALCYRSMLPGAAYWREFELFRDGEQPRR